MSFADSIVEEATLSRVAAHPLLFPELSGRLAEQAFENHTHVFRVLETRKFGNFFQRKVGVGEQLLDAAALDPTDFRLG